MKMLRMTAMAALLAGPVVGMSLPARAATAHNSQAGEFGASSNPTSSTPASRRVRHASKAAVTAPETDRDAGMYVVKPESAPESFGHATGSDGSMTSE